MYGIDVSTFQRNIDYKSVDTDFAMIRCGYGKELYEKQTDAMYEKHYKGFKDAGIPVGAYHYSYAVNTSDAIAEADFCLHLLKNKQFEMPIVYDVEDACQIKLNKKQLTDVAYTFLEKVENAGYYVMLYSSLSWLRVKFDMERLKRFDVWVANWTDKQPNFGVNYGMWQFTNRGIVKGIPTPVDRDKTMGKDYPKIIIDNGLNGFGKIKPVEKPFKVGEEVIYTGRLYGNSSGGAPGKSVKDFKATITIVNDNPYGVHLNQIGWADKSKIRRC